MTQTLVFYYDNSDKFVHLKRKKIHDEIKLLKEKELAMLLFMLLFGLFLFISYKIYVVLTYEKYIAVVFKFYL